MIATATRESVTGHVAGYRTGSDAQDIKRSFQENLRLLLGYLPVTATPHDLYTALAVASGDSAGCCGGVVGGIAGDADTGAGSASCWHPYRMPSRNSPAHDHRGRFSGM